ncbi:MAG: hypothetical protein QNJ36_13655 [Calothrix sp. MO_167.B42]|nr:hypothetical protein [Calothrix sp. MO_167.B42]
MDSQFSGILLDKLKTLILDLQEKKFLEEEARNIEQLNEIIEKIKNGSTDNSLLTIKEQIESRIVQGRRSSAARKLAKTLTPQEKEARGQIIDEYK